MIPFQTMYGFRSRRQVVMKLTQISGGPKMVPSVLRLVRLLVLVASSVAVDLVQGDPGIS